jgi:uncharacterized phage protein (TIGR02220 family)
MSGSTNWRNESEVKPLDIIDLLANDNYIIANKTIARLYGLEEAILLGELASEFKYWQRRDELKDGWFYSTIENVKDNTTLSEKKQRTALLNLKAAGLVDVKLAGIPAKRYIKINTEQLWQILTNNLRQNGETSSANLAELDAPNRSTNNNNNSNKNSNKKDIYIAVIARLNEKAGTNYRASTKSTQSHINARLAEGFTLEDFFSVIDKKCAEWKGDEKMEKYLRPETLFGNKFENYLNAPAIPKRGASGIAVSKRDSELDEIF